MFYIRTFHQHLRTAVINKFRPSAANALADVPDGATVMIGGFGTAGLPNELIDALIAQGARELTVINNNAGNGDSGLAALLAAGRVRKIVCSFPRQADSHHFDRLYRAGRIELELVPQGNLAERIRAAGAGIGAFFTPTGYGTPLAEGKETRVIGGRGQVLEYPIHADYALIQAERGDIVGEARGRCRHTRARKIDVRCVVRTVVVVVRARRRTDCADAVKRNAPACQSSLRRQFVSAQRAFKLRRALKNDALHSNALGCGHVFFAIIHH